MSRLDQQIQFLLAADGLKTVIRQNFLADRSRHENSAEHSWHLALMAQVLKEYFPAEVDFTRVTQMLIIHDLVEVIAGDTFVYAEENVHALKAAKEIEAAHTLFGKLPPNQFKDFLNLWQEFEAAESLDSRAAKAIDSLQPVLLNYYTEGGSWKVHGIRRSQIEKRLELACSFSPALHDLIVKILDESVQKGWVRL